MTLRPGHGARRPGLQSHRRAVPARPAGDDRVEAGRGAAGGRGQPRICAHSELDPTPSRRVGEHLLARGSPPDLYCGPSSAEVAQLVERLLAKEKVASSSLVFRSSAHHLNTGLAHAGPFVYQGPHQRPRLRQFVPKWRNGRRGGLKNRWGATPVWVRIPPSVPIPDSEQTAASAIPPLRHDPGASGGGDSVTVARPVYAAPRDGLCIRP